MLFTDRDRRPRRAPAGGRRIEVTMREIISALLLATLAGCAVSAVDDPRPRVDGAACYLAAEVVVEAWEAHVGPVSDDCRERLATYTIDVTPTVVEDCEMLSPGPGKRLVGCVAPRERAIYIEEDADMGARVDIAVHEWTHALDACIGRTAWEDVQEHADPILWGQGDGGALMNGGIDSVVGLARTNAAIGPCL